MNRNLYPFFKPNSDFWRRKQSVSQRKKKIKTFGKISILLLFFLLIFFLYAGFVKLENYVRRSEILKLKEIKIHSKSERIKNEVEVMIKGLGLGNIMFIKSEEIKRNIMKNPYVRDVKIKRILPSKIEIFVEEREGIAILKDNNYLLLDERGEVIEKAEDLNLLPLIKGASLEDRIAIEIAMIFIKGLKKLNYEELIEEIDVSNPFNLTVKMKNSQVRVYLGESEWLEKFIKFLKMENALKKELGEIEYVGFYDKERLYVKRKSQN